MKCNKFLVIYLFTITILIGLGFFALNRAKSEIYFNMWLNQIIAKSDSGTLFITRGEDYVMDKIYMAGKLKIDLDVVSTIVRYEAKTKSLNIFLMTPKIENETLSYVSFKNIPNDVSKKICKNVKAKTLYGSMSNQFTINGEEVMYDFVKLLNKVECHFLADNKETEMLVSTGGWTFPNPIDGKQEPFEFSGE